jgi:uncharacterized membrane-anchored protein YitT (DUF2179 family)
MVMRTILDNVRTYFLMAVGLLIFSVGWTAFLLPHQISGSGVSGLAAIIFYATGIPMGYTYFAINVVLVIIGMKILGPASAVKTIYGILVAATMLSILQPLLPDAIVQEKFMSALIGGGLCGVGLAIIFTQGGSTGGHRNISLGRVILYCDVIIIGSSYVILTDLEPIQRVETIVYGFVTMAILAYTLDTILSGNRQSVQVLIFSRHYDRIADQITEKLHRGVTVIDGTGWYSKENQKVIITLVRKNEASDLYRIIRSIDDKAFITVANVMGVFGRGFEELKR